MKKIYLFLALAVGLLASCDMDKTPYDALPDDEALQTPTDFANARVGLYSGLRSSVGGSSFFCAPEIQCDGFNAVIGFSNTQGSMYQWTFTTSDSPFSTVYGNYQAMIARANYILDGIEKVDMSNENLFTDAAKAQLEIIKGEALFIRAFCIFQLSQYFCADYEPATASQENSGVSYRLDYAPSSSASSYPARKTLEETFTQIYTDINAAAACLTTAGEPSSYLISADAITALRARVALAHHDYDIAAKAAESLITSNTYVLADSEDALKDLWQNDGGAETILQLAYGQQAELPTSGSGYSIFQPYATGSNPDYIPTQALVDLYSANDYRKSVYFNVVNINTTSGTTGQVYGFNKYIDHGGLYNRFNQYEYARFTIEPKVFRIAEMYLIAVEAFAQSSAADGLTKAAKYLNDLEKSRIAGYQERSFPSKDAILAELKIEREREMVGEGTRLFDIKRWHIDMKRGTPQQEDLCLIPGATTTNMVVAADSPKLTWPIPKHETDANGNVKQNPGY